MSDTTYELLRSRAPANLFPSGNQLCSKEGYRNKRTCQ